MIFARPRGRRVEGNGRSQEFVRGDPPVAYLKKALRPRAGTFIFSRPKHAKSQFPGCSRGKFEKLVALSRREGDENLWAMNESAREGGALLGRGDQAAGKLILAMRDATEIERFNGSLARGIGIYAAYAEQRHRNILRQGEGWQQAWVGKKKAERSGTEALKVFIGKVSDASSIHVHPSRVGGLKQTKNAQKESSPRCIRAIELANHSQIERSRDILDRRGLSGLVPILTMARDVLAGKNRIHFQNGIPFAPSSHDL